MSSPPIIGLGFGARFLFDAHQNWSNEGLPVYIRTQNADDEDADFADLGFIVSVTGNLAKESGTTDTLITPPPTVYTDPTNRQGVEQTQLQEITLRLVISHTWVLSWMAKMGYTGNPVEVFRDRTKVIGIFHANELWSIESISNETLGAEIINWNVTCKGSQQNVSNVF
jgi:hypothetical protein